MGKRMSDLPPGVSTIPITQVIAQYDSGPGRHWFDPDTMRFFHTKLPDVAYVGPGGTFFVTREKREVGEPELCTVRQFVGRGEIETIGRFHEATMGRATRDAIAAAAKVAD